MVYHPAKLSIPNKVCIVDARWTNEPIGTEPVQISFSSKINSPPNKTIAIVDNEFLGPFYVGPLRQPNNSSFYSELTIFNAIKSTLNPKLEIDLRHWSINEVFMEGLVQKGGVIAPGTIFVAAVYGQYSTMIIKDGAIYNDVMGK